MGFVSLYFLGFLAVLFPVYFLVKKNYRWIVLLVASVIFYALCSWKSIFFITFTTLIVYFVGKWITNNKEKEKKFFEENKEISPELKKNLKKKNKKSRKRMLALGIISIVLVLAVMKYLDFLIGNLNSIINWFDTSVKLKRVNLFLPLGISFYTFSAIGYMADVYWGKYEGEKNFFKLALFMIFFPKVIQGPITRYNEISQALFEGHDFDYENFTDGLKRMLYGYFKKVVIADCLVVFTSYAFANPTSLSGYEALIAVFCYFIYDYCDFSGYMDIACGVSSCLGVKLPENFNHPYFSTRIDEYWRRWHMTLGSWFKDYVFYPLSISKFSLAIGRKSKKIFKKYANKIPGIFGLIVVWLLTGLWHGASWNYILWGLYFGAIIIFSVIFDPIFDALYAKLKINKDAWWLKVFRHIRTLVLLAFGKVLFETNSLQATFTFFGKMFDGRDYFSLITLTSYIGKPSLIAALCCSLVVLAVDIIQEIHPETTFLQKMKKTKIPVQWTAYLILLICVIWLGYYGGGLPKFEFGYMRF